MVGTMADEECRRGMVTPLAHLIPIEDLERAVQHMNECIDSHAQHLQQLQQYLHDNIALAKLLCTLPDSVRYNVMVPFGKLAFFPGSLIHTNELLVLLGESYYSERSTKQTIDILERRNQYLELKITSLKAQILDFQAEVEFASNTAAEAAEGVVEIREDHYEPTSQSSNMMSLATATAAPVPHFLNKLIDDESKTVVRQLREVKDEEHERIMARLSEIEMAEEAATAEEEDDRESEVKGAWTLTTAKVFDKASNKDEDEDTIDLEHEMVDVEQYDAEITDDGLDSFREKILFNDRDKNTNRLASAGSTSDHDFPKPSQEASKRLASAMDIGVRNIDTTPVVESPADLLEFEQRRRKKLEQEIRLREKVMGPEDGALQTSSGVKEKDNLDNRTPGSKSISFAQDKELSNVTKCPSASQKQAFSGTVVERNNVFASSDANLKSDVTTTKIISRFRMRQGA
ncbi:hypothetical protein O6H91_17G078300 [Diphasiastrum complanatum]|uniref:Uncharacterized protein n=1 Tax=Diphasiastrum complanatum TaxID=34168 RepID=A0ACC2B8I9_DIPCM|nr:hypothetical protein O6H91_17G078300 [Diphasiastrum complanatum]